jgi:hypothetical protein
LKQRTERVDCHAETRARFSIAGPQFRYVVVASVCDPDVGPITGDVRLGVLLRPNAPSKEPSLARNLFTMLLTLVTQILAPSKAMPNWETTSARLRFGVDTLRLGIMAATMMATTRKRLTW